MCVCNFTILVNTLQIFKKKILWATWMQPQLAIHSIDPTLAPDPTHLILPALSPSGRDLGLQGQQSVEQHPGLLDLGLNVGVGVLAKCLWGVHIGQHADILFVGRQRSILGYVVSGHSRNPVQDNNKKQLCMLNLYQRITYLCSLNCWLNFSNRNI